MQLDQEKLGSMRLEELPLRPKMATPGCEIRLFGNNSGMKLTIEQAVISRMDCNAPQYSSGNSDINTNYISAALSSSGGSSGSPVVNIKGEVVGLNCGGINSTSINFLLPLELPVKALNRLTSNKAVSRGTIQTKWSLKPLNECFRSGLSSEWEQFFREKLMKYNAIVADVVLPEGPADKHLMAGDILLKVNNDPLTELTHLEECMDFNVDGMVKLTYWRHDREHEAEILVADLHAITPDRIFTRASAYFHRLSFQKAIEYAIPAKGVYISSGQASFRCGYLLESINGQETPDLDRLCAVMSNIKDSTHIVTCYKALNDLHTPIRETSYLPSKPCDKLKHMRREPRQGGPWIAYEASQECDDVLALDNDTQALDLEISGPSVKPPLPKNGVPPHINEIFRSVVSFECYPFDSVEGQDNRKFHGYGLIFDAQRGLIIAPRHLGTFFADTSITIAEQNDVKGQIIYLHHSVNLMVIKYDSSLVRDEVPSIKLSTRTPEPGDEIYFAGLDCGIYAAVKTTINYIMDTTTGPWGRQVCPHVSCFGRIFTDTLMEQKCYTAAFLDDQGAIAALQFDNEKGKGDCPSCTISLNTIRSVISSIEADDLSALRYLGIDIAPRKLKHAARIGLSREWLSRIASEGTPQARCLEVSKIASPMPSETEEPQGQALHQGDIILTLDGRLTTEASDLNYIRNQPNLSAQVFRQGKELTVTVPTFSITDLDVTYFIHFCGATVHKPHLAARQNFNPLHSEVYLSAFDAGGPAKLYGLNTVTFICDVDGSRIVTMEDFREAVRKIPNNKYFNLTVKAWNMPRVVSLKKNTKYFPTLECRKDFSCSNGGWQTNIIDDED